MNAKMTFKKSIVERSRIPRITIENCELMKWISALVIKIKTNKTKK